MRTADLQTRLQAKARSRLRRKATWILHGGRKRKHEPLVEYQGRPIEFAREVLGIEFWSRQLEAIDMVNTWQETYISSGHGVGKSTWVAAFANYWFCTGIGPVLLTSSSNTQLRDMLWDQSLQTQRLDAARALPGIVKEGLMEIVVPGTKKWWLKARTTDKPERFQGRHIDYLLVIIDEAAGFPRRLWRAIKGWLSSNVGCKIVAIGNPNEDLSSEFARAFHERQGDVGTLYISCEDSPYVSKQWIADREKEWGRDSVDFLTRVLGRWPTDSTDKVLPLDRLEHAHKLWHQLPPDDGRIQKVFWDVAGRGKDHNALVGLQGQRIRVFRYWKKRDFLDSAHDVFEWMRALPKERRPRVLMLDATGMGDGAYLEMRRLWKNPAWRDVVSGTQLVGVQWSATPHSRNEFGSLVDECYGLLRRRLDPSRPLEQRLALPPQDDLPGKLTVGEMDAQLNAKRFWFDERHKFVTEGKEDLRKRRVKSPDVADAIAGLMHVPPRVEVSMLSV